MQTINSINEMKSIVTSLKAEGRTVALVPTMGSLHPGHTSQIDAANEKADVTIVSIFINPTQFGPNDDILKYPSNLELDLEICKSHGVDFVFTPKTNAIYPADFSTYVDENKISSRLSGLSRPYFFKGFATIITILLNITRPDYLILGQKDVQQTAIIKKVVRDLLFPVNIIVMPIVRNDSGLAWSTANHYLQGSQKNEAIKLYQSLKIAKEMVNKGITNVDRVITEVTHYLSQSLKIRISYVSIINPETLDPLRVIEPGQSLLAVAVWVDQIRLNDNIIL